MNRRLRYLSSLIGSVVYIRWRKSTPTWNGVVPVCSGVLRAVGIDSGGKIRASLGDWTPEWAAFSGDIYSRKDPGRIECPVIPREEQKKCETCGKVA